MERNNPLSKIIPITLCGLGVFAFDLSAQKLKQRPIEAHDLCLRQEGPHIVPWGKDTRALIDQIFKHLKETAGMSEKPIRVLFHPLERGSLSDAYCERPNDPRFPRAVHIYYRVLERVHSVDELAFVLAHELGHAYFPPIPLREHPAYSRAIYEGCQRAYVRDCGAQQSSEKCREIFDASFKGALHDRDLFKEFEARCQAEYPNGYDDGVINGVDQARYGLETDADFFALKLMAQAGFDPKQARRHFVHATDLEWAENETGLSWDYLFSAPYSEHASHQARTRMLEAELSRTCSGGF